MHMEAIMLTTTRISRIICSLFFVSLFINPAMASTSDTGHDWYCPDHEGHQQYEKHLKLHLNHSSDAIADKLDAIYSNSDFSSEEKKEKALHVIDKYLSKMKAGIGD